MLSAETIADESRLLSHAAEWTDLADACGSPCSQPGWALAWCGTRARLVPSCERPSYETAGASSPSRHLG